MRMTQAVKQIWATHGTQTHTPRLFIHLLLGILRLLLLLLSEKPAPTELSTHCLLQMHQLLQGHVARQGQQVHQQGSGEHGGVLWRRGEGKQ